MTFLRCVAIRATPTAPLRATPLPHLSPATVLSSAATLIPSGAALHGVVFCLAWHSAAPFSLSALRSLCCGQNAACATFSFRTRSSRSRICRRLLPLLQWQQEEYWFLATPRRALVWCSRLRRSLCYLPSSALAWNKPENL
ncbi:hypothetical protein OPV22_022378 [Ensete ventricosum]|uniref:Uncharacterized protein n=1 Tax=Ensete ventricosum TaxID=4639 RepID=A0AAV8PE24_ENSVE|nr:hypothetical protein OPV22_022378 [Ensete ventricosum]